MMTKKFTEKQYQNIVNTYELKNDYVEAIRLVLDYIDELNCMGYKEAIAIANPLTREWAHDKFVDKEPEFHFILKDIQDLKGWRYHLVRNGSGAIILYQFSEEDDDNPKFKESEIKLWGFNPEMFDKKGYN